MARLIDLNKIPHKAFRGDQDDLVDALFVAPTVDAVPVVRCKDCVFYNDGWCRKAHNQGMYSGTLDYERHRKFVNNWFCADGERKGGDE